VVVALYVRVVGCRFILNKKEYGSTGHRDIEQEFFSPELNGTFHFIKFETSRLDGALELIKQSGLTHPGSHIYGTGGGAIKFQKKFKETLHVGVQKFDELETLVNGMGFLMYHFPNECYTLRNFRFAESSHMTQEFRQKGPEYPCVIALRCVAWSASSNRGDHSHSTAARPNECWWCACALFS
jgi:hypothetical protein